MTGNSQGSNTATRSNPVLRSQSIQFADWDNRLTTVARQFGRHRHGADTTVMNVSISQTVEDLNTGVAGLQTIVTVYTLAVAALKLIGDRVTGSFTWLLVCASKPAAALVLLYFPDNPRDAAGGQRPER